MKNPFNLIKNAYRILANDSLQNTILRLGDGSKSAQSWFSNDLGFTRNWVQLNAMYRSHWIPKRIVNLPADDMTRAWVNLTTVKAPADITKIQQYEKKLHVKARFNEALKWARLYGGAIIYMDFGETTDPSKPIFANQVGLGGLKALHTIDRWRLTPSGELNDLSTGSGFGLPKHYIFENKVLHHTRCIRLISEDLPWIERYRENHWSESVLEPVFDTVKKYYSISDSVLELAFTARLREMKVEGLREAATESADRLSKLLSTYQVLADYANNNGIQITDALDQLSTQSYSFSGLPDVMINFMTEVCGAAEIPMTKLWGQCVKGLNATGEGELREYYDTIRTKQEARLYDPLTTLYSFLVPSVLGAMPADFDFEFKPLWQISDKEAAEIVYQQAQADNIYEQMSAISAKTVNKELRQRGYYQNVTEESLLTPPVETESPLPGVRPKPGAKPVPYPASEPEPKPGAIPEPKI